LSCFHKIANFEHKLLAADSHLVDGEFCKWQNTVRFPGIARKNCNTSSVQNRRETF